MLTWHMGELPDDMADTSSLWLTGLHWMTWRGLVSWDDVALMWQKSTDVEELINLPWKLLFPSSLAPVNCCRCWWRWRKRRGSVILLGTGGTRKGVVVPVVSLLDGDPLMRGSVVVAEGDGTVDGGRWRSVALPLLRWTTSRCWLWWVGGWLRLVVCATDLVAEAESLLWRRHYKRFGVTAGGVESGLLSENLSSWVLLWSALMQNFRSALLHAVIGSRFAEFAAAVCWWRRWTVFPLFFFQNSRIFPFFLFRSNLI